MPSDWGRSVPNEPQSGGRPIPVPGLGALTAAHSGDSPSVSVAGAWSVPAGSQRADRRSTAASIAGVDRVAWSVDLPWEGVTAATVATDGTAFVSGDSSLVAVRDRRIAWSRPADPFGGSVLLDGGLLATVTAGSLDVLRQSDGRPVATLPWAGGLLPAVLPGLLVQVEPGGLHAVDFGGRTAWRLHLPGTARSSPLVVDSVLAVVDGRGVRFVSRDGRPLWQVDPVGDDGKPLVPTGLLISQGRGTVVAQVRGAEDYALLLADLRDRSVSRLAVHLPPERPAMVTADGLLVTAGWEVHDASQPPAARLTLVDLASGVARSRELPAQLVGLAGAGDGSFCYAVSPTAERWRDYRHFPGFDRVTRAEVGLLGSGRAGHWETPGPITGPLAVGAAGEVLVPVAGRLFALTD